MEGDAKCSVFFFAIVTQHSIAQHRTVHYIKENENESENKTNVWKLHFFCHEAKERTSISTSASASAS